MRACEARAEDAEENATELESFEVQLGAEEMATLRLTDTLGTFQARNGQKKCLGEPRQTDRVESCLGQVQSSAVLAGVQSDFDSSLAGAMIIAVSFCKNICEDRTPIRG